MPNLTELLGVLHEDLDLSSAEEIKEACILIVDIEALNGAERDTLRTAFKHGPLWAGDVPSKTARDSLVAKGYMAYVIVKGEEGYSACTQKGFWAAKLIEVMYG